MLRRRCTYHPGCRSPPAADIWPRTQMSEEEDEVMLIKTIRNGVESEKFELTKKIHRSLLADPPDAVVVRIEDLYPNSPDKGILVKLEFSLFNVLSRDFVLEENRYKKSLERYHDTRSLEEIEQSGDYALITMVEEEYLQHEFDLLLHHTKVLLTETQGRRLQKYLEDGLSFTEIGRQEGVSYKAVAYSIKGALGKLNKYLNRYF